MSTARTTPPRDPWASEVGAPDHFGLFTFFAVLVLFGGVAYAIYSGYRDSGTSPDGLFGRDRTAERLAAALAPVGQPPVPLQLNPGVVPDTVPTAAPAPPIAPAPPAQASGVLYVPPVARAMGSATAPVVPTATPQPTLTPVPLPISSRFKVVNTDGDGVFLRRSPRLDDKILAWPDNTVMVYQGEQADADGVHWAKIRDPRGNVGWVPTQYLGPP